ncbi:MAG: DUF1294 domain-containing protein [Clostridia bacterium]|nr:DUF1294 domain-containing protein [Clostridia bacterium]
MQIATKWALAWLIAASVMANVVTVWDKRRARRQAWRVPERTLWLVSILGGSVATYLTMRIIRHKTLHRQFMWGLPLLVVAQAVLLFFLWRKECIIFT